MKKIIIIAYDFNPAFGSEAGVSYIWGNIIASGYQTVVYTQSLHRPYLEKAGCTIPMRYVPSVPVVSGLLRRLGLYNYDYGFFIKKIAKLIQQDIVAGETLIHFLSPFGIHSFSNLAQQHNLPYIVGPVGGFLKMPPGFEQYRRLGMRLKELFYSLLLRQKRWQIYYEQAERIICGTELVAQHLPPKAKDKVNIIYDSVVDGDYFYCDSPRLQRDKVTIIFSGRLVLYKGCFLLLQAFAALVAKGVNNIELIFAGEGPEMDNLKAFVAAHKLEQKVSLLGRLSRERLRDELRKADIYCLPTLKDPGGNAVFEAMACGLPIITSNYGGPAYSVAKDCGILIDPINIPDYIERLSSAILQLSENRDLRLQMGARAREHVVASYSSNTLSAQVLALISQF